MLDPKWVRTEPETVAGLLQKKGYSLDIEKVKALEEQRKSLQVETESLQNERNTRSKNIGKAKAAGEDIAPLLAEVENLKSDLESRKAALDTLTEEFDDLLYGIPNIPAGAVPAGTTEEDNQEIRRWGEPRQFDFEPKDHVELGEQSGGLDFETAVKITGSRFVVMKGEIAKLHRALVQFMLDTHTGEHGYTEVNVPNMVNGDSAYGTGQLPKFGEDLFKLTDERGFYLIDRKSVV